MAVRLGNDWFPAGQQVEERRKKKKKKLEKDTDAVQYVRAQR